MIAFQWSFSASHGTTSFVFLFPIIRFLIGFLVFFACRAADDVCMCSIEDADLATREDEETSRRASFRACARNIALYIRACAGVCAGLF